MAKKKSSLRKKREQAARATRSAMNSVGKIPSVKQQETQLAKLSESKLAEMMEGFDSGESTTIGAEELETRKTKRRGGSRMPEGLKMDELKAGGDDSGAQSLEDIVRGIDDKLDEIIGIMRG